MCRGSLEWGSTKARMGAPSAGLWHKGLMNTVVRGDGKLNRLQLHQRALIALSFWFESQVLEMALKPPAVPVAALGWR